MATKATLKGRQELLALRCVVCHVALHETARGGCVECIYSVPVEAVVAR